MLSKPEIIKLSRFISLILRHKPETIHIDMDRNGWVNVNDLISGIQRHGYKIDFKILKYIVDTDDKQRYSFNDDFTLIRANQGHSIRVDVGLKELEPPQYLFHGTATKYQDSINFNGLIPKSRMYVHLSEDLETAIKVGSRHGTPIVFQVEALRMSVAGYKFYKSVNGVWLTEEVPSKYLKIYTSEV